MKAVAITWVAVQDVDVEALARPGVEHAAGDSSVPGRLVHVRVDDLRLVRARKVRVQVLPINQRVQRRAQDFVARNTAIVMTWIEHAVAAIAPRAHDRRERAVAGQRFDLEKDVASAEFHVKGLHLALYETTQAPVYLEEEQKRRVSMACPQLEQAAVQNFLLRVTAEPL